MVVYLLPDFLLIIFLTHSTAAVRREKDEWLCDFKANVRSYHEAVIFNFPCLQHSSHRREGRRREKPELVKTLQSALAKILKI